MTESDWLSGTQPEAMLRRVGERLTPRRWHLLACAVARRAAEALPEGPLRAALDTVERASGKPLKPAMVRKLQKSAAEVVEQARDAQRQIVRPAHPEADPSDFKHDDSAPVAAVVYYQAACHQAVTAVDQAGQAAETAAQIVLAIVSQAPGADLLAKIRTAVIEATQLRGAANLAAAAALDFKARGDDAADRGSKNVRVRYAAALETVRKTEEDLTQKLQALEDQKTKAERKAFGRALHDLIGNPFQPYRFEPAWRTRPVIALAKAIADERAFEKMPALAEALLDADCDAEAVLRHCRGTEAHAPEGPSHGRGCWVLDLILQEEPSLFSAPVLVPPPPPPPPAPPLKRKAPAHPDPVAALFAALKKGVPPPDSD